MKTFQNVDLLQHLDKIKFQLKIPPPPSHIQTTLQIIPGKEDLENDFESPPFLMTMTFRLLHVILVK